MSQTLRSCASHSMALHFRPRPSSSLLLLRRLSASPSPSPSPTQAPNPPPNIGPSTPSTVADDLSPAESHLLEKLHFIIKDHHRNHPNPDPSASPPPNLTIPDLSSSFSSIFPLPPSPALTHHIIRRFSTLRHGIPFPQILSFFNWWISFSPSSPSKPFTSMIDLAGKLHHFDLAWHFLDSMHALSIPIPLSAFSSLIRRYSRANRPSEAINAFHRMPDYGLEPDPISFSLLLAALSRQRLAVQAQSLFDSFSSRFPPDVVIYSNLVHAWCRAGSLEKAEQAFAAMRNAGIQPNVYTYTTVIDAMCRAGQIPRAQEVLCQMLDSGCTPNAATFNCFMRAHVRAGRSEQALQVHNQMRRLGCEPDGITYNFLIEAHCSKGQKNLDAALKVLNSMILKGKECAPDANSFNHILKCVLILGDVKAAHKLYEKMREIECQPSTVTYNILMQLFSKDKTMDMVLKMKKEMEKEGVEPNVNTYGVLITAFCERGSWRRSYQLMRELLEDKCLKPTKQVYEKVQELLRRAGQLRKHDELVEIMAERGFISPPPLDC
ncbi:Pentatricopeptide repeat-containing protein [Dendrobium catenatum]|uniref:Pentatricopeptide repeat-containing protein n=1 Tax=Dendrobium catenatum TaxID=906689 RepID=A0A2I0XGQ0_9ASPA|nr:Pentatricopeptide repeat-containing protein [Dendrobium catenatum]